MEGRRRRWFAALITLFVMVLLPATPAFAHASFVRSNPVDGSVLSEAPSVAELEFTEPVLASASNVHLLFLGSDRDDNLALSTVHGGTTVLAEMPHLDKGAYILRYVVVDPADLHKTVGSISFGVGVAAPPSEAGEQVDSSLIAIVLKWMSNAALLLSVGAIVLAIAAVRSRHGELHVIGRVATLATATLGLAWIGLLFADAATVGFDNVRWGSLLISSDPGRRALVGVAMAAAVWWAFGMVRRVAAFEARLFVLRIIGVIGAVLVIAEAYGGHAGIGGSFVVGVVLRALHLASLCIWIGAVSALWLVTRREESARSMWPQVSTMAAAGLALTGVTGFLLSGRVASTVTALLGTNYGKWIVAKIVLLVVLALLGAVATRRVSRGLPPMVAPVEMVIAAGALVFASLLASSAPARGEQFLPPKTQEPQIVTSNVADLTVSAAIQPAQPGANLVEVRVLDTRRPSPGPIQNVLVQIQGADGTVVAKRSGVPQQGVLQWADVSMPNPGTYRIQVDVTRPNAPVPPYVASWQVDPPPVARAKTVVSTRSWAPIAAALAAAWLVVVAAGWWLSRRFRPVVSHAASLVD